MGVTYEEAKAIQKQNGNALDKLNQPDNLINILRCIAPSEDGSIDYDKAMMILGEYINLNNHMIKEIPYIKDIEKTEIKK